MTELFYTGSRKELESRILGLSSEAGRVMKITFKN